MDPVSSLIIAGIVVCLLVLAFTSAVEAALTAISRHRLNQLQEEDGPRKTLVARLLEDPYRFKVAIMLLNITGMITITALTLYMVRMLAIGEQIGILVGLALVILVVCEALPRALALRDPGAMARQLAGPMVMLAQLLWPLIALLNFLTGPLTYALNGRTAAKHPLVTEEELRLLVNVGEEEGLIEPDEREMIEGIFSFGDTMVREIMIPRVDIVALEDTAALEEALDLVIAKGHSRIPVYRETIDQVVGILYAKDLLPWMRSGRHDIGLSTLLRQPHFVPETMKVDALLKDLQTRRVHLAIVVDEYGGTAGLATIEDLLEQIVGDIQDEYDREEPEFQLTGEGELTVDARVLLDEINDLTGLQLESDETDRIGGYVSERLGRVPKVGDTVQAGDAVTISVLSVEGLRVRRLHIRYRPAAVELDQINEEAANAERSA